MRLLRRLWHRRRAAATAVQPLPGPRATWLAPARPDETTVQLGFADGSTLALAPDSPQARALRAVAAALLQRRGQPNG